MKKAAIKKDEKNFLIMLFIINALFELAFIVGLGFFLFFGNFKKEYLLDSVNFMNVGFPAVFFILTIVFLPKLISLYKDISSQTVLEGIGTIIALGTGYSANDQFIQIDTFGKDKIKRQRPLKDKSILYTGSHVNFRIAPSSKMLLTLSKA